MDSAEATTVLNEVLASLEGTGLERYKFEIRTDANERYSVCIRAFLGAVRKRQVEDIAAKHKLTISEESEGLILR
jgi:hypothetical protein